MVFILRRGPAGYSIYYALLDVPPVLVSLLVRVQRAVQQLGVNLATSPRELLRYVFVPGCLQAGSSGIVNMAGITMPTMATLGLWQG